MPHTQLEEAAAAVEETTAAVVEIENEEEFMSDIVYEMLNRDFFSLYPIIPGVFDPSESLENALNWIQTHSYAHDPSEEDPEEAYLFDDEAYAGYLEHSLAHMYGILNQVMQIMYAMIVGRYSNTNGSALDNFPQEMRDATKTGNHDLILKYLIRGSMAFDDEIHAALKMYPVPGNIDDHIAIYNILPSHVQTSVVDIIEKAMVQVYEGNGSSPGI